MPSYEMLVLVRRLAKEDVAACLKRGANFILDNNGVLRKIENLGNKPLHRKLSNPIPNAKKFSAANFFLFHFDMAPTTLSKVYEDFKQDNDMIRSYQVEKGSRLPEDYQCTLEQELRPPAIRASVQNLIEEGRKKKPTYDMGKPNARQIA